jgi:putative membrane protein
MMFFGLHGLGWIFSGLLSVALFILVIVMIVRLLAGPKRWHGQMPGGFTPPAAQQNTKALEILAERFAKGEISEEDYRRMKESLGK